MLDPRRQRFGDAQRLVKHVLTKVPNHPIAQVLQQRLDNLPR